MLAGVTSQDADPEVMAKARAKMDELVKSAEVTIGGNLEAVEDAPTVETKEVAPLLAFTEAPGGMESVPEPSHYYPFILRGCGCDNFPSQSG